MPDEQVPNQDYMGPVERTEWRAVGYDKPERAFNQDASNSYEYGEWMDDLEAVEADAQEMVRSELPYDDVWIEKRVLTATAPERVEVAAVAKEDGNA